MKGIPRRSAPSDGALLLGMASKREKKLVMGSVKRQEERRVMKK